MRITLDIKESRLSTFLAFIKTLDYVSISENEIPQWQIEEVNKQMKAYEINPDSAVDFDKALDDIENEL